MKNNRPETAVTHTKHKIPAFAAGLLCFFMAAAAYSQPGTWAWMNGDNTTNATAVYGPPGIFAPAHHPAGLVSPARWRDHSGNFWIFGGQLNGGRHGDMWCFNPVTNQWAWMNGPGLPDAPPDFGLQGVPAPSNYPGARTDIAATWVDNNGNLWLFGGRGLDDAGNLGNLNDLWKFDIVTGEWCWVHGSNAISAPGNYGTQGVPAPTNQPGARFDASASWTAPDGSLWLYGGSDNTTFFNDLWKFDIPSNEWTWVHGTAGTQVPATYGTQGIPNAANTPGSRRVYSSWSDNCGNLWLFGGRVASSAGDANDVWKFDLALGQWTWMGGPNIANAGGAAGLNCMANTGFYPCSRWANSASAVDFTGRFWLFGGRDFYSSTTWNDLWAFNTITREFSCVKGLPSAVAPANYGTPLSGTATTMPPERFYSTAWSDNAGNLWMFGGSGFRNDMWRFTPSANCPPWTTGSAASFNADVRAGCPPLTVQFTNNSTNANHYQWYFGDGTVSTQAQPSHVFTTPGRYLVTLIATDSTNCNQLGSTDTLFIDVIPSFTVSLGSDTTICSNTPVTYVAGPQGLTYSWNTGATTASYTATSTGIYSVTVSGGSCFSYDSVTVTVVPAPSLNLGNDTVICGNGPVNLNANPGNINNGFSYLWSTNETTAYILGNQPGTYWALVSNSICAESDTIEVQFLRTPELGTDTTLCEGETYTLNADPATGQYLWSTNETTSSITVSTGGTYAVTSTHTGCVQADTIQIAFAPVPVVNIGKDTVLCDLVAIQLDAGNPGHTYEWNTGETTQLINVAQSGVYSVTVSNGTCEASDTTEVTYAWRPNLGPDTISCPGVPFLLNAGAADSWQWSNGAQSQIIAVSTTGTYSVTTTIAQCEFSDTINLVFKTFPFVNLGPDKIACPGEMVELDAEMGGLNNGCNFIWSNGSTFAQQSIRSEGDYSVTVTFDGCTSTDTIFIDFETMPAMLQEVSLCEVDPLVLKPEINGVHYLWSDGSNAASLLVQQPGTFWVQVTTENCIHTDTVEVIGESGHGLVYLPNAFTPNGDGSNDTFGGQGSGLTWYHLQVFNRWGQLVFESGHTGSEWNGEMNGQPAQEGTYSFVVNYRTHCTKDRTLTRFGTVELIR